jgi:hemerythrin superfamily protein
MDAIKLLETQHRKVEDLFAQIEEATEADEKEAIFGEIADNLAAHATIEEQIFYPAVYKGDARELLDEAVEEHLAIKRILADLLDMDGDDDQFDAKIKVCKEQVEHHVKEEEGELFKKVRKQLDKEELERLGARMEKLFETEIGGIPSEKIPTEIDAATPLR